MAAVHIVLQNQIVVEGVFLNNGEAYSNCCEEVGGVVVGGKDGIKGAALVVFDIREDCLIVALWKVQSYIFGKGCFKFTVNLLKGDVKGWKHSSFVFSFGNKVVPAVVEFEVDRQIES